jgi:hypothetical protein
LAELEGSLGSGLKSVALISAASGRASASTLAGIMLARVGRSADFLKRPASQASQPEARTVFTSGVSPISESISGFTSRGVSSLPLVWICACSIDAMLCSSTSS